MNYLLKYLHLTATTNSSLKNVYSKFSQRHKRKIVIDLIEKIQLMVIISLNKLVSIYKQPLNGIQADLVVTQGGKIIDFTSS